MARVSSENSDFLMLAIVEDLKVFFLQSRHGRAIFGHNYVDLHQARSGAEDQLGRLRA